MARGRSSHEPQDEPEEVPAIDVELSDLPPPKRQPIHVIKLKNLRVVIWENWTEYGPMFNVTFSRIYRDHEQQWQHTESLGLNDLLLAAKVLDLAHSWICQHIEDSG
jgi:hypothetical protein